jgi:SAM-dependent methyltransferase
MQQELYNAFGNIDIYLFDQLLKGRFDHCKNILDIGCGSGRNIHYFLKQGFNVFGIDQDEETIERVKQLSTELAPHNLLANFSVAKAEELPFANDKFDLVISSAVFHFAHSEAHFNNMVLSAFRVIKPGGFLFSRLASNIGIEDLVVSLGSGRFLLPDGSERFLVTQQMLLDYTSKLNGVLFEPIKTTNVHNLRCMTTWCVQKKEY